ncbi:hypothetical protein C1646_750638 [Rhizophagus diaphanus]|nr:hypothetical protein C1646_750638 [Rhizophagus diaphanus] [Rhizophagus sp. MUCL 43196]
MFCQDFGRDLIVEILDCRDFELSRFCCRFCVSRASGCRDIPQNFIPDLRKNSQASGSKSASPENKFTFSLPKDTSDAPQYESIWKNYQQKLKPTSDKKLTEVMNEYGKRYCPKHLWSFS